MTQRLDWGLPCCRIGAQPAEGWGSPVDDNDRNSPCNKIIVTMCVLYFTLWFFILYNDQFLSQSHHNSTRFLSQTVLD